MRLSVLHGSTRICKTMYSCYSNIPLNLIFQMSISIVSLSVKKYPFPCCSPSFMARHVSVKQCTPVILIFLLIWYFIYLINRIYHYTPEGTRESHLSVHDLPRLAPTQLYVLFTCGSSLVRGSIKDTYYRLNKCCWCDYFVLRTLDPRQ